MVPLIQVLNRFPHNCSVHYSIIQIIIGAFHLDAMQPMNNNFFSSYKTKLNKYQAMKIPEIAFHSLFARPIYTEGSPCLSVKSISKYFTSLAIQNSDLLCILIQALGG